jgi:hypothetical protein
MDNVNATLAAVFTVDSRIRLSGFAQETQLAVATVEDERRYGL